MANLFLFIGRSGETIPVLDVDLEHTTNVELCQALLDEGIISDEIEHVHIMGKDNVLIMNNQTLQDLGFKDGDRVVVSQSYHKVFLSEFDL